MSASPVANLQGRQACTWLASNATVAGSYALFVGTDANGKRGLYAFARRMQLPRDPPVGGHTHAMAG
jgi:hypothetical protein